MANPFDLMFLWAVGVLLLVLVVGTAGFLALAALLPRGNPIADWIRNVAGKMPRFADVSVRFLYGLVYFGGIALAVIATLVYA